MDDENKEDAREESLTVKEEETRKRGLFSKLSKKAYLVKHEVKELKGHAYLKTSLGGLKTQRMFFAVEGRRDGRHCSHR